MERIGAGTTAIPHRDRARGARGRRAARRRGPWTRHNDTRDFVTVPPHRAIRGGSDRESTDHTTPPYDASMRTPARTRPRESEKPGVNCAFKILSLPYSGSPGVVFQISQGRNGIRARPRAAPRVMKAIRTALEPWLSSCRAVEAPSSRCRGAVKALPVEPVE